jgi:hypothetical protein
VKARHELHWVPGEGRLRLIAAHPMEPDNGCGWVGREPTDDEFALFAAEMESDMERNGVTDTDGMDHYLGWHSGEYEINGLHFRASDSLFIVTNWCMFSEQDDWWTSIEEAVEGAKWTGDPDITIPVALIGDAYYDSYPEIRTIDPWEPADAAAHHHHRRSATTDARVASTTPTGTGRSDRGTPTPTPPHGSSDGGARRDLHPRT